MEVTYLRLAENIAVLRRICDKPIAPTRNDLITTDNRKGRALSLQDEVDIVNDISYLVSHSYQPGQVMAMCVEELSDEHSMIVSVATNDGSTSHLEGSLRGMADILQQQNLDARTNRSDALLNQVILRSEGRLSRRLDYVPSSGPGKIRESTTVLRLNAILDYATKADPELKQSQSELFILAKEMSRLAQVYIGLAHKKKAGSSSIEALLAIVKVTSKLWGHYSNTLLQLNTSAPNLNMKSETKEKFPSRIRHLGHYVHTAIRLLEFASKFNVFRSIHIRAVHVKPYDLSTATIRDQPECQQRFLCLESQNAGKTNEWQLKLTHAAIKGQEQVRKYTTQPQTQGSIRVHAEIQILCFYEQHPNARFPPRVLKSSKHACFLCDSFIKMHGKFHIPKTHGKLYELWMLPDLCDLDLGEKLKNNFIQVMKRFNEVLEEMISSSDLRVKQSLPEPDESCILSLVLSPHVASNTTIRPLSESKLPADPDTSFCTPIVDNPISSKLAPNPTRAEELNGRPEPLTLIAEGIPSISELPRNGNETVQVTNVTSPRPTLVLQQGKPSTYVFDKTETIARFHTPKIHVELSNEEARRLANINPLSKDENMFVAITVEVSWLGSDESNEMTTPKDHSINLESRWTELTAIDGILFTDEGLLMRKGVDVVRIRALHVDSRQGERRDSLYD
ncbi:OTT-1508-deam domain containing protein [Pyrenophora teres f. teres]|uniref:OTT-1508-deam domain containing protein n=1 Tax=Pyrenophora teres f. teres TaxID=97479 RepID=A0A6S6WAF2_9PLEO|nr:hypothetical protein PTNB29_06706 [Pyrenophora teres f. teres]CAE7202286.1 OTT-1508-deam domain containing protein [Pyrenophora teres f. teres]